LWFSKITILWVLAASDAVDLSIRFNKIYKVLEAIACTRRQIQVIHLATAIGCLETILGTIDTASDLTVWAWGLVMSALDESSREYDGSRSQACICTSWSGIIFIVTDFTAIDRWNIEAEFRCWFNLNSSSSSSLGNWNGSSHWSDCEDRYKRAKMHCKRRRACCFLSDYGSTVLIYIHFQPSTKQMAFVANKLNH